jgi:hypothetical protein
MRCGNNQDILHYQREGWLSNAGMPTPLSRQGADTDGPGSLTWELVAVSLHLVTDLWKNSGQVARIKPAPE